MRFKPGDLIHNRSCDTWILVLGGNERLYTYDLLRLVNGEAVRDKQCNVEWLAAYEIKQRAPTE